MRRSTRRLLPGCAAFCAIAAALLAVPGTALAQAGPERIVSYDVSIDIQRNGSSLVTEQIDYDFGTQQRHGIFRQIPVRAGYNASYDRIYPVHVVWVDSPDAPYRYTVSSNGSILTIRIGDPGITVTGLHTYRITYLIRGTLNGFAGHDELYWNAIGDSWNVPMDQAVVRVTAPGRVTRAACFAGPPGSTTRCEQTAVVKRTATFTQTALDPHDGLTVVVAFPKGLVPPPRPVLAERWTPQRAFAVTPVSAGLAGALLAMLAVIAAMIVVRRRSQAAPPGAASGAAPLFPQMPALPGGAPPALETESPAALRPAQASTLLDGVVKARDITATVVDLAVRGYLRIEDPPWQAGRRRQDWQLVRLDRAGGLLPYEQAILDGLFMSATKEPDEGTLSARLSELGADFVVALKDARAALYQDVTSNGWFTAPPDRVRLRWRAAGLATLAAAVAAVIATAALTQLALVPVPLVLAGLAMMGCARWMPVRTAAGNELARRVLGFRGWLIASAAGQGGPAARQAALYRDLPYAIALNCTREWAGLTASLAGYDQAGEAPLWYRGRGTLTPGNYASLRYCSFYFSRPHTFAVMAGQQLASGGSSGGSGFSGGFSGGGGGGGGGGSW